MFNSSNLRDMFDRARLLSIEPATCIKAVDKSRRKPGQSPEVRHAKVAEFLLLFLDLYVRTTFFFCFVALECCMFNVHVSMLHIFAVWSLEFGFWQRLVPPLHTGRGGRPENYLLGNQEALQLPHDFEAVSFHFNHFRATIRPWCLTFPGWWASTTSKDTITYEHIWVLDVQFIWDQVHRNRLRKVLLAWSGTVLTIVCRVSQQNATSTHNKHGPMPNAPGLRRASPDHRRQLAAWNLVNAEPNRPVWSM